ncbi:DUF3052 domain-containing protein [Georgenia yuyongxinii]|uniref:DUF3052 domain-containing protein n=1 Tax=Georgenia yuyongxinii TaxID=2589797 RepID=A0A552WVK6_9MICO|nr:DUF3052 domain-containing protein [Georgenia yuyongxinii]TRW46868.1 DUF3052 domain-containing protein [Georgenia yuyongxinii]
MAVSAGAGAGNRFGFTTGQVIQEFGYDDDVDPSVREKIETVTGTELVDEEYGDVCDGTLIWWREDDAEHDDLTDLLVEAQSNLEDGGGLIWVLTPKPGRQGHVRPADVEEAARTAGMHATSAATVADEWSGIRIASRSRGR